MKLTKGQVIFLTIISLVAGYFLSTVFLFAFNNAIKIFFKSFTVDFLLNALINSYPHAYESLLCGMLLSFLIVFLIPFIPKAESLHGEARFANGMDVKKMDLYNDKGIIIGKYNGKLLRFKGQQFVSLGAPTRSGKGVGIVIPNLLDWQQSAVVQDIKQECFDFTSKYRKEVLGQEVYLFNPFSRRTHRYNPLHYIDMDGDNADGELTDFANILYPAVGNDTTIFFNQLAQDLFIGLCYMQHDLMNSSRSIIFLEQNNLKTDFSLAGILELSEGFNFTIVDDEEIEMEISGFEQTYTYCLETGMLGEKAKRRIKSYFDIDSENTRSGVMSSFKAPLSQFRSDNMRYATSGNDFDFRDLRKKKMTIFVGILPDQLANAKQILNIFWQQLILVNTKELPQTNKELKYQVMLLMDEFTASGYLQTYLKAISFIAGYNLRSLMIYQANSQLEIAPPDGYGREGAKTLLTNHACQIFYTPREQEDAEKISKILGNKTVRQRSRNIGKGGGGSESKTSRALMLPQELREMSFEDEIITIDNGKPIKCKKAFYYNDKYFMDKFKEISPSLRKIKNIPTKDELESAIQNDETRIPIPNQGKEKTDEEYEKMIEKKLEKYVEQSNGEEIK